MSLRGESFETALNPTGLMKSSPMVCSRYTAMSHVGATAPEARALCDAMDATQNPPASINKPHANFVTISGSQFLRRIAAHSNVITGASAMTMSELSD